MSDRNERACALCGSLLHHEDDCQLPSMAMISTGNAEQDQAHLAAHCRSSALIKNGDCPNGCGRLTVLGPGQRQCPKCGFVCYGGF